MLTSVENSPSIDIYSKPFYLSNSSSTFVNDSTEWDDLKQLVCRSSLYRPLNTNKYQNSANSRKIINNNSSVSHENIPIQEVKKMLNDQISDSIVLPLEYTKKSNNIRNFTESANACVNVNMGYNEGSSFESIACNVKASTKPDVNLIKTKVVKSVENPGTAVVDAPSTTVYQPLESLTSKGHSQIKTFKNGSKAGHSRQWGSCGSTVTSELKIVDKNINGKVSLDSKHVISANCGSPPLLRTIDIRHKSVCGLKRISQVSLEAEFDSEGRTHEQITIDFRNVNPYTISGQITLIELSYFTAVKSEEFLSFKWTGQSKQVHAPGIVSSTRWFNQLNFWAQRIILECKELTRRSEMLTYIIRVIKKLVDNFNNLSSGMALMSALQVECIHRLKLTWNALTNKDRATFRRMEELFSSENNYEKLRDHINSLKLPCIPYLGLYLTDLTFINIAHSKLSEFESQTRSDQINNILRTVSEFQQSEYEIVRSPILYRYLESQRYIEEMQKLIEEYNYKDSNLLEPINGDHSSHHTRHPPEVPSNGAAQKTPQPNTFSQAPLGMKVLHLQSPISPKPISVKPHNESIIEVPEQSLDNQLLSPINHPTLGLPTNHGNVAPTSAINDRYSEDDSVRASFLCGTGRRSLYKKRSTNKSIRFNRNNSFSLHHHELPKKTTPTNSVGCVTINDKEALGVQCKSLLDDSYLQTATTDTCSGTTVLDMDGQSLCVGDLDASSNVQNEILRSPPICKCLLKGDTITIKPMASASHKSEYWNLLNVCHAAESVSKLRNKHNVFPLNCSDDPEINFDHDLDMTGKEDVKLICQGVLSMKTYFNNSKISTFSMWNRHWVVLVMLRNSAYLVLFENSQFHATERKDFKNSKCLVQDLKGVIVTREDPMIDRTSFCHNVDTSQISDDSDLTGKMKKFFLIDREYGAVYKFKDTRSKFRKSPHSKQGVSSSAEDDPLQKNSTITNPSSPLILWYRLLKRSIGIVNNQMEDNKDLIFLADS